MNVSVDKIVKDVKVAIDMDNTNIGLLDAGDVDALALEDLVKSKIEDGVRLTHMEAPVTLLDWGHTLPDTEPTDSTESETVPTDSTMKGFAGSGISWGKNNSGVLILPDTFMRLIVFQMSDWEMPVYQAIDAREPSINAMVHSKWAGVSGNPENPVCVIVQRAEGLALEFYGCEGKTATIKQGVYLPFPKINDSGQIDICEKCYSAAVYRIAALVLATYGDQQSATLADMSKALLA